MTILRDKLYIGGHWVAPAGAGLIDVIDPSDASVYARIPEVGREQMQQLMAHTWPGNVRELRNAAECLVLGLRRDFGTTPSPEARGASLAEAVENFERSLIAAELRRQNGNLARSSEALQVAKTTLHDKIRKYGLA